MAFIEWDDSFSVNISEIDRQHQTLFRMINDLDAAIQEDSNEDALRRIAGGLINYIDLHFSREETYFDEFGYSDAKKHKKEHATFVQKVLTFMDGFEQGNVKTSTDMMQFLKKWLMTHIKGSDRKYASLFIERGVK